MSTPSLSSSSQSSTSQILLSTSKRDRNGISTSQASAAVSGGKRFCTGIPATDIDIAAAILNSISRPIVFGPPLSTQPPRIIVTTPSSGTSNTSIHIELSPKTIKLYNGTILFHRIVQGQDIYAGRKGEVYRGEVSNGRPEGKGYLKSAIGNMYWGLFAGGVRCGKGFLKYPDGSSYEGEFKDNLPHGQGIMYKNNGEVYKGSFVNGQPHGQGTLYFPDKSRYMGQFENGRPDRKKSGVYVRTVSSTFPIGLPSAGVASSSSEPPQ